MSWYDRAEEYDICFDWGPGRERDFVLGASERWGIARPGRILEPFCGPGRLLRHMPGFAVGLDLNPHMVRHASRDCRVFLADAARFGVRDRSFDLAYCLIDSFRHLLSEEAAWTHLRSVAKALRPGAVYVLGFDITGDLPSVPDAEEWTSERGSVTITAQVKLLGDADPETRIETAHTILDVNRGGSKERIEDFMALRVYSRRQFEDLLDDEGSFEIAGVFDRRYDLDDGRELSELEGSGVLVLLRDGSLLPS